MGLNYISSPLYSVVTNVISQPGPDLSVSACVQGWSIVFLIRFIGGERGEGIIGVYFVSFWCIWDNFLILYGGIFSVSHWEEKALLEEYTHSHVPVCP